MKDTTPEFEAMVRSRYLAMTPAERLMIGVGMFESARAMAIASFPPGISADESRRRLCERLYPELASLVFGKG